MESMNSEEARHLNRQNLSKEPVLTVAMLNEIFKSHENVEVFELPRSDQTSEEDENNDDESIDRPPTLIASMEQGLSISPMPIRSNALEMANVTDDYGAARGQQL